MDKYVHKTQQPLIQGSLYSAMLLASDVWQYSNCHMHTHAVAHPACNQFVSLGTRHNMRYLDLGIWEWDTYLTISSSLNIVPLYLKYYVSMGGAHLCNKDISTSVYTLCSICELCSSVEAW